MALELTDANFKEKALAPETVSVVDFWAEWCGPCRMVAPVIEELSKEYDGKVVVGKVDVDNNHQVSMAYGIRSIPTIMIFKNGEMFDRHVGTISKAALAEKIERALS
jgi:thioredoxin 1